MRRSALILAVLMVAAAPATAFAAKKAAAPADPNANGKKFVAAGFNQPVVLWQAASKPWWVAKKK
jgi:hypothetical protein